MKKILSLLIALLVAGSSICALAQNDLESLVLSVKSRIEIPESYKNFSSDQSTYEGETTWNLRWTIENKNEKIGINPEYAGIYVSVTSDGIIRNYNSFEYKSNYKPYSKLILPSINEDEAASIAIDMSKKINPEIASEFDFENYQEPCLSNGNYFFKFRRVANGISVDNDAANVTVNGVTGKATDYYCNWTKSIELKKPEGIISQDDAKKAFIKELPLKLTYTRKYTPDENTPKADLVYELQANKGIDAFTGKPVSFDESNNIYNGKGGAGGDEFQRMAKTKSPEVRLENLEEYELAEIEQVKDLITAEEARDKLLSMPELAFDKDFTVQSSSTYKGSNEQYTMYIDFSKRTEDASFYASASFNAKTGELLSFYSNIDNAEIIERKGETPQSQIKAATDFVQKYMPEKAAKVKPGSENYGGSVLFERYENDIVYPNNTVSIRYNKENKITNLYSSWDYDIVFEDPKGILDAAQAAEKLFEQNAPELVYKKIGLIYSPDYEKPTMVGAKTGEAYNYLESSEKFFGYDDIDSHYAKDIINLLAKSGVYLPGKSFEPDKVITQGEFLTLLSACIVRYPIPLKEVYSYFISNDVIKADEQDPDAPLNRETAVKYFVKLMGYSKVAELSYIFNCTFQDKDDISPELIGSVTIASSLGIIKGNENGEFLPKKETTRAEAMIMIYNYLKNG